MESHDDGGTKIRIDSGEVEVGDGMSFSETLEGIRDTVGMLVASIINVEGVMDLEKRDMTREEKSQIEALVENLKENTKLAQQKFGNMEPFDMQNLGDEIKTLVTKHTGVYFQGNHVLGGVLDRLKVNWSLPNKDMEDFLKKKREEME